MATKDEKGVMKLKFVSFIHCGFEEHAQAGEIKFL